MKSLVVVAGLCFVASGVGVGVAHADKKAPSQNDDDEDPLGAPPKRPAPTPPKKKAPAADDDDDAPKPKPVKKADKADKADKSDTKKKAPKKADEDPAVAKAKAERAARAERDERERAEKVEKAERAAKAEKERLDKAKAKAKPDPKAKKKPAQADDDEIEMDDVATPVKTAKPKPAPKVEKVEKVEPLSEPVSPDHVSVEDDTASGADTIAAVKVAPERSHGRKKWHVRAGLAIVDPLSTSKELVLADVNGPASLAVQNGPIAGSGASISSATIPAIILGYDLPYANGKLALETVLGTPFTVKFQATGTLATMSLAPTALGIPTGVPPLGSDLGEAKAAPPLVTLVYSPLKDHTFQPYVGAGAAILIALDAKVTNPILTEVAVPQMHVSPAPGFVMQGGFDVKIVKGVYARFDVKYIAGMQANAEVTHIQVKTPTLPLFDTVEVGTAKMSVMVNPLIIQAGLGTDF